MDPRERINEYQDSFRAAFSGQQAQIWTALPAIVTKVDLAKATIEATPAVQAYVYTKDGTPSVVTLPTLLDVPIHFPRGGGYVATFPVQPGDEVLVVFSSRNIDAWWQQGGIQAPLTARFHDLSDGFAIPGVYSQKTVPSGISTTTARLTSEDTKNFVEIDKVNGKVNIVADQSITLTAPNVTVNASQTVYVNTPDYALKASNLATVETPSYDVQATNIIGLNAPGINFTAASAVTAFTPQFNPTGVVNILNQNNSVNALMAQGVGNFSGDVIAGTISLQKHLTTAVTGGPGLSGPPVG